MLVVWQHSSEMLARIPEVAARGAAFAAFAWNFDFGRIGVVCFFLISGFVIPYSFPSGAAAVKSFAIRRFFRLFPAYWLSILAAIFVYRICEGKEFSLVEVLANLTMIQGFLGVGHIQGLYWTLQVELVFYALCVILFRCGLLWRLSIQISMCVLLLVTFFLVSVLDKYSVLGFSLSQEMRYLPYVLAIMYSGTVLRQYFFPREGVAKFWGLSGVVLVFSIPVLVFVLSIFGLNFVEHPGRFFFGHLFGLVIFVGGFYVLRIESRILLWLGAISYSLYLFHPIVMKMVGLWVDKALSVGVEATHMGVLICFISLLTMGVASLVYRFVEMPSIALGRHLSRGQGTHVV